MYVLSLYLPIMLFLRNKIKYMEKKKYGIQCSLCSVTLLSVKNLDGRDL